MVDDILNATGIQHKAVRFLYPPDGTYAVWFDTIEARGPDDHVMIHDHSASIELYSDKIDAEAEAAIEQELERRGLHYEKTERMWINDEKMYEVVYQFDFIEKKGAIIYG